MPPDAHALSDADRERLSRFIADAMGLHFPPERWPDLQRGLAGAASEWGFPDLPSAVGQLLSETPTKEQLQALAHHLTIGETYFFREKKTFEVLARDVLPGLIQSRRGGERRLRVWSAACCTGEEAYSLAIMLHQLLPDLADWRVSILATDINARFLRKAAAATYGEWSFRDTPAGYRDSYFEPGGNGRYVVCPAIRRLVTFAQLNLVDDIYPSSATDTTAMDLIFCRNALMYFTPAQSSRVIARLHRSLLDGGWLAVSPSEASQALFPQFATRNSPGVILYQKEDANLREARDIRPPDAPAVFVAHAPAADEWVRSASGEAPFASPPPFVPSPPPPPVSPVPAPSAPTASAPSPATLARTCANEGRLAEALAWCERWIAADKLDPAAHYLRGAILLEHGDPAQARASLQRVVYLQPDFVLAHFALGNLARTGGRSAEADKQFAHALRLLARLPPAEPLPESDNLTAGRLTAIITAMLPHKTLR